MEIGLPAPAFTEHLDHTVWRVEGDAHLPPDVAHGFADAAPMAEAYGFRPGPNPYDLWGGVD